MDRFQPQATMESTLKLSTSLDCQLHTRLLLVRTRVKWNSLQRSYARNHNKYLGDSLKETLMLLKTINNLKLSFSNNYNKHSISLPNRCINPCRLCPAKISSHHKIQSPLQAQLKKVRILSLKDMQWVSLISSQSISKYKRVLILLSMTSLNRPKFLISHK